MTAADRQHVAQAARNARLDFFRLEEQREQDRREEALANRPHWADYPTLWRMTSKDANTLLTAVLQRLSTGPPEHPDGLWAHEISQAACLAGALCRFKKVDDRRLENVLAAARRHAPLWGVPEKWAEDSAKESLSLGWWSAKEAEEFLRRGEDPPRETPLERRL